MNAKKLKLLRLAVSSVPPGGVPAIVAGLVEAGHIPPPTTRDMYRALRIARDKAQQERES